MGTITVTQGGPDIEPGTYSVVLKAIDGPKVITAKNGPNAGESSTIFDWTFEITDGGAEGEEVRQATSTNSGPRSKMYSWLTALLGGKPPAIGQTFEFGDLIGHEAIATISKTESGWPKIDQLSAVPQRLRQPRRPAAMGEAPTPAPAPAPAQVPADEDGAELPF